ncbi:hypothetical protein SRB5_17120 [Streptomyces sp. RB5]|uniref:Metallo-beta-lactamase domain-containing protein n=1 Tax=Streptomyces smaragdinus TaxID=2585196 RepID=A0A7K0CE29_9ACTN|nr:hypothetical protein [Streptomyces smaragdinus]
MDLRLVPPAGAAWAGAAWALGTSAAWVWPVCAGALLLALGLIAFAALRRGPGASGLPGGPHSAGVSRLPGSPRPPGVSGSPGGLRPFGASGSPRDPHPPGAPGVPRPRGASARRLAGAAAAALLCGATAAGVAAAYVDDVRRGPLPGLAADYGDAVVEVEVTGDPRPTRPHVRGAARAPDGVVLAGRAVRVSEDTGRVTRTRTPVLVVVTPKGRAGAAWLALLPSTRIRVAARVAPPVLQGDSIAAALRVGAGGPPRIVRPPSGLQRKAGDLRQGLREATDPLGADARALLPGLVVGDTSGIPAELRDAFQATDLTHLLAVSGANLTIVLALLIGPPHLAGRAERRGLARLLGLPTRVTAVAAGALTLGFVIVCRPEPSVLRAAACGLITLLALATGRRRSLIPALAAAALLLVLYDPWLARDYGFALSVLATGALLTVAPRWAAAFRRRGMRPRPAEALAAAAAAQAVCAPVVAVLAARISLVAVPCNLLSEPAVAPATVLGFAALATAPLALPVAKGLAWLASWPVEWIAWLARTGASLPGAQLPWPGSWPGAALLALLTLAVVAVGRRLLHRPWACACVALLLLAVLTRPPPLTRILTGWPPPGWRAVVCDVGQGDAIVVALGEGSALVVDAGPEPAPVASCLRDLGITRIPLLVLTHFHADHVDGLPGVLNGRAVGAIETTAAPDPPDQAAYVHRLAARAGIPVITAAAGERRRTGDVSWEVLWPVPGTPTEGPNNASVTLLVRTAGLTLLLPGDLEPPAQQELLTAHPDLPQVDVLKVPHHGSAYQHHPLLTHLNPRLSLISAGPDNPYGHPSPRTITTLRTAGSTVLRTDTQGSLAVLPGPRAATSEGPAP